MIPEDFIETLLAHTDLRAIVEEVVELKGNQGCCPFHSENTPSFSIHPTDQYFNCFGCGAAGNAIRFIELHHAVPFPQAVSMLASRAGLPMPASSGSAPLQRTPPPILSEAAHIFAREVHVNRNDAALNYLLGRRPRDVTDQEWLDHLLSWCVGASTRLLDTDLKDRRDDLINAGLLKEKDGKTYDCFINRIMFPIHDRAGAVLGFTGRSLSTSKDDKFPKYVNSVASDHFKKAACFYGIHRVKPTPERILDGDGSELLVVEGQFDVLAHRAVSTVRTVAVSGTAFTEQHAQQALNLADRVIVCLDGDQAGLEATWKTMLKFIKILALPKSVYFVSLPGGHDPASYLQEHSVGELHAYIKENARPLSLYLADTLKSRNPGAHLEAKEVQRDKAQRVLSLVTDHRLREVLGRHLSSELGVDLTTKPTRKAKSQASAAVVGPLSNLTRALGCIIYHPSLASANVTTHETADATLLLIQRIESTLLGSTAIHKNSPPEHVVAFITNKLNDPDVQAAVDAAYHMGAGWVEWRSPALAEGCYRAIKNQLACQTEMEHLKQVVINGTATAHDRERYISLLNKKKA